MTAILLVALEIFLLLLRAHFNRNDDKEKALAKVREAQSKLEELAFAFETRARYSSPPKTQIDHLQDKIDHDRKRGF